MRLYKDLTCPVLIALCVGMTAFSCAAVRIGPDWQIVHPDKGAPLITVQLKVAAEELQRDIKEATGFSLPLVPLSKAHGPAIWLGEEAAVRGGVMRKDLRDFQNVIAEKSGNVFLFGHDVPKNETSTDWNHGCLPTVRAVTRFLHEHVGVRFLMPGETGTEVTHRGPVGLPEGAFDRENPVMVYSTAVPRGMIYGYGNGIFGCGREHTYGGHSYEPAVPGQKYAKSHPEYYGLINGRRMAVNGGAPLCVSNPEVQQLMVDELCRRFDEGADSCQLGQQDGFRGCECERCEAIGGGGLDWGERLWIVHRDIAARIARLRPGKVVHIMSYGPTASPPRTFKVFPENVMIELCSYTEGSFERWSNYTVPRGFTVYVYLWGDYPRTGYTPKNSFPYVAMMARRFARQKIKGMFRCGFGEIYGMEGPFYYVFNRLLEKPDADVKTVVAEYCQAAFGPAAIQMLAFYERLNLQLQCNSLINNGWEGADVGVGLGDYRETWSGGALPLLAYTYSPNAIQFMEGALVRAEKTPGLTEKMKRRLGIVRLEWTYAKNLGMIGSYYAAYKLNPTKASFAPLAAALRERNAFLEWIYEKSPTPGKVAGWPEYQLFGGYGRRSVMTNGRLSAKISAPLDWNVDLLEKNEILPGASRKTMRAMRARSIPSIEDLESGEWARASWHSLVGSQLQKLTHAARAKALYDDEALYVVVESDLEDGRMVRECGHDGQVWAYEAVELLVDPSESRSRYYHFVVGPHPNSVYDEAAGLIADPLHPLFNKCDPSWNAKSVTVVHRRAKDRWRALLRIPYADVGAGRPTSGETWGLNIARQWVGDGKLVDAELGFWNPNIENGSFAVPEAMGNLTFE